MRSNVHRLPVSMYGSSPHIETRAGDVNSAARDSQLLGVLNLEFRF